MRKLRSALQMLSHVTDQHRGSGMGVILRIRIAGRGKMGSIRSKYGTVVMVAVRPKVGWKSSPIVLLGGRVAKTHLGGAKIAPTLRNVLPYSRTSRVRP